MIIRPTVITTNPIYTYMEKLAEHLSTPVINDSITVPPDKGRGFIKNIFFEDDFCVRYFNISFPADNEFDWCFEKDNEEITFKLVFTIGEDITAETSDPKSFAQNSTILYSVDPVKPFIIPANTAVNRIALLFTAGWLNRNFTDANVKLHEIIESLSSRNRPVIISQKMGIAFYSVVKELADEMSLEQFPMIHIKTKSLLLLNTFLDEEVCKIPAKDAAVLSVYQETMLEIDKKLKAAIFSGMPSITELAHEFNMSPSTLQRHFKMVFGKNIYQHYLEMKMNTGKDMLTTKSKSISEVAYLLGYNKINSFSKLFKKFFGVLPKEVKRKKVK